MNTKHVMRKLPSCLLGAILAAGIASSTTVNAVDGDPDPGLFELEGNTTDDGGEGTDWDPLYVESLKPLQNPPVAPNYPTNLVTFTGVVADPAPKSIFWKGGSKDINDINEWWHKDGSVPDKDDITNAYAAAFSNPTQVCVDNLTDNNVVPCGNGAVTRHAVGDLIVYFGLDRYANDGDAFAGFWFYQNEVALNGSQFSGVHKARDANGPGDMLILVEYPQASNAHPEIKIYEWVESGGDVATHLDLLATVSNAECVDDGKAQVACAITNLDELTDAPAWPYTPKSGNTANIPFESFFEGGVNVTQLLGSTPCFSAFLAETRASRSETATLKDFALGNFDVCGADVTKDCKATINTEGNEVTVNFSGTASNIGGLPLYMELKDSVGDSVITAVCFNPSGPLGVCAAGDAKPSDLNDLSGGDVDTATFTLAAGETVRYEGNYLVTTFNNQTSFTDTVSLQYFDDPAAAALGTETDDANCPPEGTPGILVDKKCDNPRVVDGNKFMADITGTVKNTGNVKLINVTLADVANTGPAVPLTVVYDANKNGLVDGGEAPFTSGTGSLDAKAWLAFKGTVNSSTTSHKDTLTATGTNFLLPASTPVSHSDDAACAPTVTQGLTITKVCDEEVGGGSGVELVVDGGKVVVQVGNIITVTNTGNEDLKDVLISDTEVQTLSLVVTNPPTGAGLSCNGASCTGTLEAGETVTFRQTYKPDGASGSTTGDLGEPNTVFFNNIASAQGTGVLSGTELPKEEADASCELCPPHGE